MNERRRMTSIARRVGCAQAAALFRAFLALDLILVLMCVGGFIYYSETTQTGTFELGRERVLEVDHALPLLERLDSLEYSFVSGEQTYRVSGQAFFTLARRLMTALLVMEGWMALSRLLRGGRRAHWVLEPLSSMTEETRRLTDVTPTEPDDMGLHDLEDAISRLSPTQEGARVETSVRELKGLEDAVNSLLKRMRQSYDQQARFVSDASHELRTPISVIQGYADLLARWGKTDPKVLDEGIGAIGGEVRHMQRLVEQLLFLARGDSGRTRLSMTAFSLSDMMRELHDEYSMIDTTHEWQCEADDGVTAYGDPGMLKQTARILADNAIKYTPAGGHVTLRARTQDGCPVLEVQDNGIGMSEEDATHIFERFFRSDPARSRQTGGTGLGLSIAKWIVDRHGGYFQVLTREGIGTRVRVFLPAKPPESTADQA